MLKLQHWSYDFACDQPIDAILAAFNAAGPWQWEMRDSDFYGDYLSCRPKERVHVRVFEYARNWRAVSAGRREGFSAWLECDAENTATRSETDQVFRRLLQGINATKIIET